MKQLLIKLIHIYQRHISAGLPRRCKYEPTCSQYAINSIQIHGAFKGTILSSWRILRCNPWSKGGVDWVPEKGSWPRKPLGYAELMEYRAQTEEADIDSMASSSVENSK
ncbi:MAG: membrane protein insertion efficiency factor YidD [Arcanobacterium sp.]|nr:membrane protein insertion efficiency factor YidD [Arcanobacterium sp.]